MAIRKLEKKQNKNIILAKAAFLLIVLFSAILIGNTAKKTLSNKSKPQQTTHVENIFSSFKPSSSDVKKILGEQSTIVQKQLNPVKKEVEKEVLRIGSEAQDEVQKALSELIFSKTIKPIIDQINRLPPDQQELLKQELCK